jgi:hypothetical protein
VSLMEMDCGGVQLSRGVEPAGWVWLEEGNIVTECGGVLGAVQAAGGDRLGRALAVQPRKTTGNLGPVDRSQDLPNVTRSQLQIQTVPAV